MTSPFGCRACGGADHWEAACPELLQPPAKTRKEHMARIEKYVGWCIEGLPGPTRITPFQKQKLIEAENKRWKAQERKAG